MMISRRNFLAVAGAAAAAAALTACGGTGNIGAKGSCVIPVNLESNVVWLHQFLFDDANYSVTSNVKEYSNKIESDTSPYMNK